MAGKGTGPSPKDRKGGPGQQGNPCDRIFRTSLSGVRVASAGDLVVGSTLDVVVELVATKRTIVCRRRDNSEAVGAVLSRSASVLLDCIDLGNEYEATVAVVDYGFVEVVIRKQ